MLTSPASPEPRPGHARLLRAVLRWGAQLSEALTPAKPRPVPLSDSSQLWLRLLPHVLALCATAALLPVTVVMLVQGYGLNGAVSGPLAVAQTAPLLLAAARPLQMWYIVFAAHLVGALALLAVPEHGQPWPWSVAGIVGYALLCLAIALRERRRTLVAVWLVTAAVSLLFSLLQPDRSAGGSVVLVMVSGGVLLVGGAVRERSDAQQLLAEQETISEAERAQRTLLEERARIARELHDVVAHHMSVITVQADSAPYRLADVPLETREEFSSIAATARQSLGEMRRLLGVLRSEETQGERMPQPGLDELPALVESTVRAGVPARLTLDLADGRLAELPAALELSAYRIVQEALANVVRHAAGATTEITVEAGVEAGGAGELRVRVINASPPTQPSAPLERAGTGHGLIGMRERVRLVGGSLQTGPLPDGGFAVAATLPLDATPQREDPGPA